jgi:hypothetical protein
MAHTELEEEHYYEHPYTPNRRDNYLPNRMVIAIPNSLGWNNVYLSILLIK